MLVSSAFVLQFHFAVLSVFPTIWSDTYVRIWSILLISTPSDLVVLMECVLVFFLVLSIYAIGDPCFIPISVFKCYPRKSTNMGNETSSVPSEATTPITPTSEWQSVYSFGSKRRSSVSSTRLPTPVDPPEPDLSNLTEDEIKQIRSVIDRAKEMQHEEQQRIRELEEEYISHAVSLEQRALSAEPEKDVPLCPICMKNELCIDGSSGRKRQDICVDCGNLTCAECGAFEGSINSKLQDWVCSVCQKRRKLVFSTGLWHPGIDPTEDVPLARELEYRFESLKTGTKVKLPNEKSTSKEEVAMVASKSEKSLQHDLSLPKPSACEQTSGEAPAPIKESPVSKEEVQNTFSLQESPGSEEYPPLPVAGKSRIRAMGQSSRSDSEASDMPSDVDMEDVSMQYLHGDGMSPDDASDDYSMMSIGSSGDDSGRLRRKHRPKSLNIPQSHSATSSDEETTESNVSSDTENRLAPLAGMDEARVALAARTFAEEMEDIKTESSDEPWKELFDKSDSDTHEDTRNTYSPIAPRSPSWREGLESPPFSPRRRDSYPGKKRASSPVSPKSTKLHFTYSDISPTSRPASGEDSFSDAQSHPQYSAETVFHFAQKPLPLSPDETLSKASASGDHSFYEKSSRERKSENIEMIDYESEPHVIARIPESTACMDLATYAATIASNTANLTQMTVSPTNLQVHPGHDREQMVSPESQDSIESTSPVSPGFYDNGTIPEEDELEDLELADPSQKPIDYQGSKRQKARPPSTDWSPVIDLSPILDVSPSVEEAEQADMFVKQEEERRRRESQEEDESGDDESKHYFQPVKEEDENSSYYGLKRYDRVEDICKLLDIHPSEFEDISPKSEKDKIASIEKKLNGVSECQEVGESDLPFTCTSVPSSVQSTDMPKAPSAVFVQSKIESQMTVSKSVANSERVTPQTETESRRISENKVSASLESQSNNRPKSAEGKARRKLPEPTPEMIAAHVKKKSVKTPAVLPPVMLQKDDNQECKRGKDYATVVIPEKKITSAISKSVSESVKRKDKKLIAKEQVQKQDSDERRKKAKDMKAKPDPLIIQHIEAEEQTISPQYKVLDSPPSPESRSSLKRDYSDSTSVSPSSSPDRDLYLFPSPVTPPDSDSSPPKPHSPSSPGTDFDEDSQFEKKEVKHVHEDFNRNYEENRVKEKAKKVEQASADCRKIRRKLPPIPPEEQGPTISISQKPKLHNNASKKQLLKADPRKHRGGYTTPSSTSDESMNEEDFEVAMLTKQRRMNDLDKPSLDRWNGNYLPADVSDSKTTKNVKQMYNEDVKANIPPDTNLESKIAGVERRVDQFLREKDETDQIIDSLINIYGVPITQAMKSLKKRLQEELRRATEGRRKRIEDIEEVRALQIQIGQLKLGQEYVKAQAKRNTSSHKQGKASGQNGKKRGSVPLTAPRSSPQVMPRRSRHKRQSSDPMVSKFSPIKEDKDIEADLQIKSAKDTTDSAQSKYITDDSSQSGLSDNESIRSEPVADSRLRKIKPAAYANMFFNQNAQVQKKMPGKDSGLIPNLQPKSHSETHIPDKVKGKLYYADDDERRAREERKQQLQNEIDRRKKQLEETSRLQTELFNLTRSSQVMAHSYDDIHRKSSASYPAVRPIPTGIIKPLDDLEVDDISDEHEFVTRSHQEISRASIGRQQESSYSSSEYLAHKQESARRSRLDDVTSYSNPYLYSGNLNDPRACKPSKQKVDFYLDPSARDSGITSSVTLPELHTNRTEIDFIPNKEHVALSDTETSPPSDSTPAMPLLDDVTARSRKIIHDIGSGSRPVSAEFNLGVDDLMNGMYRVESDNSVDADEPIMKHMMEGGVTILKQLERKKQPPPPQPKIYEFPTKRILLTRDPKDRSIKGNGLGMKIVGGRTIPGTNNVGAYVAAIYQGGVAEQLHGELQEGDQIIEWNGIELSNKTYEEVQKIICQPNGEIELVVRPAPRKSKDNKKDKNSSCHSSYDNLEFVSDEIYEKCLKSNHGVDPTMLAEQLEGIKESDSPAGSQSSSQHEYMTPSISSPCSSPRSDPTSTSSDRQRHSITDSVDKADKSTQQELKDWGEIQLQLSHDDYDNTLNIHVVQARCLKPRDINGLSDPFVKIYLLPGRCADNKRRTKHISRTLNPEWYQTVMFQNLHREELKYKTLEITVWDYDRFKANDFLGEVVIDLSVPGFLDNLPHWYPLQDHDPTTGVELPKPTVLPPTVRSDEDRKRRGSPNLYRTSRDSPNMQRRRAGKAEGMGRRRRSLGTLSDVDRLSVSDSLDVSSTRSSPLLQHKPHEMHLLEMSAHAPGKVTNCFSGLSHFLSFARHFLSPCSPKRKRGTHVLRRLFPKKNIENRSMSTYWRYQSFD